MNGSVRHAYPRFIVPNLHFAPYEEVGGIRRFHLTAEPVNQELVEGVTIRAWGFNGTTPGPVIMVYEGGKGANRIAQPIA